MSGRAGQMGKESLSVDGTEPLSDVGSNMPGTPNQNLSKLFEMLNSSKPGLIKKNNSIVAQKPPSVKDKENADSPIKKRLQSRKEAKKDAERSTHGLEILGNNTFYKEEKNGQQAPIGNSRITEKSLDKMRQSFYNNGSKAGSAKQTITSPENKGTGNTKAYFNDSKKKGELFMQLEEMKEEDKSATPNKSATTNKSTTTNKSEGIVGKGPIKVIKRGKDMVTKNEEATVPASVESQLYKKITDYYERSRSTSPFSSNHTHTKGSQHTNTHTNTHNYPPLLSHTATNKGSSLSIPLPACSATNKLSLLKPEAPLLTRLLLEEKDDRYRYLIKHGTLHYIEGETYTLFVELPQIPNVIIVYRRPKEREKNTTMLNLNGRKLIHIPLLEGEEMIQHLNVSSNSVTKIENLVSLPHLKYLDLSHNKLNSIQNLGALHDLQTLLIGGNYISRMESLESLDKLQILDLHDNNIGEIGRISHMEHLIYLNLSQNRISHLPALLNGDLEEVNLADNKISTTESKCLPSSIHKLWLGGNELANVEFLSSSGVEELGIEGNPCCSAWSTKEETCCELFSLTPSIQTIYILGTGTPSTHIEVQKLVVSQVLEACALTPTDTNRGGGDKQGVSPFKKLTQALNFAKQGYIQPGDPQDNSHESPTSKFAPGGDELAKDTSGDIISHAKSVESPLDNNKSAANSEKSKREEERRNIIEQIEKEWGLEMERVCKRLHNPKGGERTQTFLRTGYCEIENEKKLCVYGNSLEVLMRSEYYDVIQEIEINYVRFEHIAYHSVIDKLKKFVNVKKLTLNHNNLSSFILLSKLESLHSITSLEIKNNDISSCVVLKTFIAYRFQHLKEFNGEYILSKEKTIAKIQYQHFDKVLSLATLATKRHPHSNSMQKRNEAKVQIKKNSDKAQEYVNDLLSHGVSYYYKNIDIEDSFENWFETQCYTVATEPEVGDMLEENMKMFLIGQKS